MFPVSQLSRIKIYPKIVDVSCSLCKWCVDWSMSATKRLRKHCKTDKNFVNTLVNGRHQRTRCVHFFFVFYFLAFGSVVRALVFYLKFRKRTEKKKYVHLRWKMVIKSQSKASNRLSHDTFNTCVALFMKKKKMYMQQQQQQQRIRSERMNEWIGGAEKKEKRKKRDVSVTSTSEKKR